MEDYNGYHIHQNRMIKLISPITYKTYKIDLNGKKEELIELIGTLLDIDSKLIKGLRDSFNNFYTISSALKNPLLNTIPNNYYTVVLRDMNEGSEIKYIEQPSLYMLNKLEIAKETSNYEKTIKMKPFPYLEEDVIYNKHNIGKDKIKEFLRIANELYKHDYINKNLKKTLDKSIKDKDISIIEILNSFMNSKKSYKELSKNIKKVIDSTYQNNDEIDNSKSDLSNESSHSNHKKRLKRKSLKTDKDNITKNKNKEDNKLKEKKILKELKEYFQKDKFSKIKELLKNKDPEIVSLIKKYQKDKDKNYLISKLENIISQNNKEDEINSDIPNEESEEQKEEEEDIENNSQSPIILRTINNNDNSQDDNNINNDINNSINKKDISESDKTIYVSSKVNEIFSTTEVTQYFTNILDKSIEVSIFFPLNDKLTLMKFEILLDGVKTISKVMKKEKAYEKYDDAIASGNLGLIQNYDDDNKFFRLNIGNLPPNTKVELKSIFIEMLGANDLSYEFNLIDFYPLFYYEGFETDLENKKIEAKFNIETQSKITRLIAPFKENLEGKDYIYKVIYSNDYKKAEIIYINNNPKLNYNKLGDDYRQSILFRTENMNEPILYCQYNPKLNETAYSINYTYISGCYQKIPIPKKPDEDNTVSYYMKYESKTVNETPGLFIFLIDQSGSMQGEPIDLVKKSLLLLVQSLKEGSYFQLIGFGTNFIKYNEQPVEYSKTKIQSITDTIKIINNLNADLGETNINGPLKEIYNDNNYSKINLSKNIILLTDGYVTYKEECLELIKNNSTKFRVHAIGIGENFDENLIQKSGELGKGTSSFVKDFQKINSAVIQALNKGLRPYITNIKFEFENYKEEISSNVITCRPLNDFSYQNEIINYSFILPGNKKLSNLEIVITGKDPNNIIKKRICFDNILILDNGEEMTKMIVGKALKYNEELLTKEKKEIEFAIKYQILSKNTALFAAILNDENQQSELIKVNLCKYELSTITPFNTLKRYKKANKKKQKKQYNKSKEKLCDMYYMKNNCKSINSNNNINQKNKELNLILSQDIIEGFWNENEETIKIIDIITQDIFDKIKDKVNELNKGENELKIIYTILVIYYLKTECAEDLEEYKLVINKAISFLKKNGIDYDDFILDI